MRLAAKVMQSTLWVEGGLEEAYVLEWTRGIQGPDWDYPAEQLLLKPLGAALGSTKRA